MATGGKVAARVSGGIRVGSRRRVVRGESASDRRGAGVRPHGGRVRPAAKFAFFTPEQAVEVEAMAAEIIPTDETPGAREAHVVAFIDRALVTFERDRQEDYRKGLDELAAPAKKLVSEREPVLGAVRRREDQAAHVDREDAVLRARARAHDHGLLRGPRARRQSRQSRLGARRLGRCARARARRSVTTTRYRRARLNPGERQ